MESFFGLLCDELGLSLSFLLDFDDWDLGEGGIDSDGSIRDGDLEADLAGESCLLSRLFERFSTLGDALAGDIEDFGTGTGLADMLVAVLRLLTEFLALELEKKRLSFGVL